MARTETLDVEVAYARADRQFLYPLRLPAGSSLRDAIEASGVLRECPEIDLSRQAVGIFGEVCGLQDRLKDQDRVEIYRGLAADPKAARRERVHRARRLRKT